MQVTITIHPSWLMRHHAKALGQALGTALAGCRALERPAPEDSGHRPTDHDDSAEPTRNNNNNNDDDDQDQLGAGIDDSADEDAPRDGRQLLGWCAKQIPDMKGTIMSFGRKRGLHTKIVSWTPDQVLAAYRHARKNQQQGAHQ
jgi:hypothetical protein